MLRNAGDPQQVRELTHFRSVYGRGSQDHQTYEQRKVVDNRGGNGGLLWTIEVDCFEIGE